MEERKIAYLIPNIEEYGKLIAYCIEHDISVFRTYWDEREKGKRCYNISFSDRRCYYSDVSYFIDQEYEIVKPNFYFDEFGVCKFRF